MKDIVKAQSFLNKYYNILLEKKSWIFNASVGFFILSFTLLHSSTFISLARDSINRDDSFHLFFIPIMSLYFAWLDRDHLKIIPTQPSYLIGSIVLVLGVAGLLAGDLGSINTLNQMSILLTISGSILLLLGSNYLKACVLPICYLVLMIPSITGPFINPLHFPSQILTATISADILNAIGIPVYRYGQFLELPRATLEVANACSGIRYLISILALAIPLAILTQENWKYRILIIAFGVIIGIAANSARVVSIGMWAYYGREVLHGPAEIFQGLFVAVVGYASLFGLTWLMGRWQGKEKKNLTKKNKETCDRLPFTEIDKMQVPAKIQFISGTSQKGIENRLSSSKRLFAIGGIFFFCWIFITFRDPIAQKLPASLGEFPLSLDNWKANPIESQEKLIVLANADEEIYRVYSNNDSKYPVHLYIAYYATQRDEKKLVYHELENLIDTNQKILLTRGNDRKIEVNRGTFKNRQVEYEIVYWYNIDGYVVASKYVAKYLNIINNFFKRKTNIAFIAMYEEKKEAGRNIGSSRNLTDFGDIIAKETDKWFIEK